MAGSRGKHKFMNVQYTCTVHCTECICTCSYVQCTCITCVCFIWLEGKIDTLYNTRQMIPSKGQM